MFKHENENYKNEVSAYLNKISSQLSKLEKDLQELKAMPAEKEYIGIDDAANFLGLKRSTLYKYTCNNQIKNYKRGKYVNFLKEDLREWINRGKRG